MSGYLQRFGVWIASALSGLFGGLVTWFMNFFTKKVASAFAGFALIALATAAFFSAINSILLGITFVIPGYMVQAAGHVIPANLLPCLAAIAAAKVAAYAYAWKVKATTAKYFGI